MNRIKTVPLMTILTALFIFIGGLSGGNSGLLSAFILAVTMNLSAIRFADKNCPATAYLSIIKPLTANKKLNLLWVYLPKEIRIEKLKGSSYGS